MTEENVKIVLEYNLITSIKLLFQRLSTPDGLSEWFAQKVIQHDKEFKFLWQESEANAEIASMKHNEFIKFRWIDDNTDCFTEFKIVPQEMTGDVTLVITDCVNTEDKEDTLRMWENNVIKLKRALGFN